MNPYRPHRLMAVPPTLRARMEITKAIDALTADEAVERARRHAEISAIRRDLEEIPELLRRAFAEYRVLLAAELRKYGPGRPRAKAGRELSKFNYNPDEPRDWHGRWTKDGAIGPASVPVPPIEVDLQAAPLRVAENASTTATDATAPAGVTGDNGVWASIGAWLRSPAPEYDLDTGKQVGETTVGAKLLPWAISAAAPFTVAALPEEAILGGAVGRIALEAGEVALDAAAEGKALVTTEGVAISGGRAIDAGASYEAGVRGMYGETRPEARQFTVIINGERIFGVADTVDGIGAQKTAVKAKYVGDWAASLRNPASPNGQQPWAIAEQQEMVAQAQKYSVGFEGGVTYHTNSIELATYYSNVFRNAGIRNFRFVITPAVRKVRLVMARSIEDILGKLEPNSAIPGTRPERADKVRYVSFDRSQHPADLFKRVVWRVEPCIAKSGGVSLANVILALPDGTSFYALEYHDDVVGWQKQIERGAAELGFLSGKIVSDAFAVSDGRSYPLSECTLERKDLAYPRGRPPRNR